MTYESKKKLRRRIMITLLWVGVAIVIFPVVWMFLTSGRSNIDITTGKMTDYSNFASNYSQMWQTIEFGKYFKNSIIIVGGTTLVALVIATFAGYALARFNFPGAGMFGIAVLATQMIPGIMFLLPLYIMFTKIQKALGFQMIDTYHGVIITYSAFFVPFSIWIVRSFFANIPKELEEAATIDGCSKFQAFYMIILPLAVPGIIATGIFIFLTAWDEVLFAMVLTNTTKTQTIPMGLRNFVGSYQNRYDLLMAASTFITIPVMIMFFSLQKYFIKGMTAGAIKG